MRIGLDGTRIDLPTGEGTYVRQTVLSLARSCPEDHFFVLVPQYCSFLELPNITQIIFGYVDGLLGRLRYYLNVRRHILPLRLDVFHNLSNYGFHRPPCPVVTTVHDLISLRFPELRPSPIQGLLYRFVLPHLLNRAQGIAASSQSTIGDLKKFYGISRQVRLTYLGFDRTCFTPDTDQDNDILSCYGLNPGYVLFVGYLTPKKNLEVIVRALAKLRSDDMHLNLVLAGKQGHGTEPLQRLIDELQLRSHIKEIGFVPENHLPALYRQASIFVFPSIYEGFGLPILEALASGVPVLASNVSSIPEVLGNHECLCPPHDEDVWASKLRALVNDSNFRSTAISLGKHQSDQFSWERCVMLLRKIYAEISAPQSKL